MKVTLFMATSINGIIATSDGREDFLSNDNWVEFTKLVQTTGSFIWGRRTYELVRNWDKSYLEPLTNATKIILSHDTHLQLDSGFTLANSPENALEKLSSLGLSQTILTGGSQNNTAFAKLGLIDEVIINIEGVILGQGIPLFHPDNFQLNLKLLGTKAISPSILQLHYQVAR